MFELFVIFKGQVQGVGFRYITKDLAESHNIKGTVRNLPDGSVELIAQAKTQEELEKFCVLIESKFPGHIQETQKQIRPPSSFYPSFSISR